MNRFKKHYRKNLKQELNLRGSLVNCQQASRIDKIVLNFGIKGIINDKKSISIALIALEAITGQKAQVTRSRKMVAKLKIRKNMVIGAKVTLRKEALDLFIDRLVYLVLPRIRQFEGLSHKRVNHQGDLTFRIANPLSFLELENQYEIFQDFNFLDITMVTNGSNKESANTLLSCFQLPFV